MTEGYFPRRVGAGVRLLCCNQLRDFRNGFRLEVELTKAAAFEGVRQLY